MTFHLECGVVEGSVILEVGYTNCNSLSYDNLQRKSGVKESSFKEKKINRDLKVLKKCNVWFKSHKAKSELSWVF